MEFFMVRQTPLASVFSRQWLNDAPLRDLSTAYRSGAVVNAAASDLAELVTLLDRINADPGKYGLTPVSLEVTQGTKDALEGLVREQSGEFSRKALTEELTLDGMRLKVGDRTILLDYVMDTIDNHFNLLARDANGQAQEVRFYTGQGSAAALAGAIRQSLSGIRGPSAAPSQPQPGPQQ